MSSIYLMLVFVIIGAIKDAGMIIALTGGMEGGPGRRATALLHRKCRKSQDWLKLRKARGWA